MAVAGSSNDLEHLADPCHYLLRARRSRRQSARICGAGGARKWVSPDAAVIEEGEAFDLDRSERVGRVGGVEGRGHFGRSAAQRGICSEA